MRLCADELTISSHISRPRSTSLPWRWDYVVLPAGAAVISLVTTLPSPKKCAKIQHPTNLPFGSWTIDSATLLHHDPLLCDRRQILDESSAHLRAASAATSEIRIRLHAVHAISEVLGQDRQAQRHHDGLQHNSRKSSRMHLPTFTEPGAHQ